MICAGRVWWGKRSNRACGECQLCCKLLPVQELDKLAGQRCKHQAHGKGCRVYHVRGLMPTSCALWNCAWLAGHDTGLRPDRAHYVVDIVPDFVTTVDTDTGERQNIPVVQVWIDPSYPDAHHHPALRAFLNERGKEGYAALIRYSNREAMTIFPPAMVADGEWHETERRIVTEQQHRFLDVATVLAER